MAKTTVPTVLHTIPPSGHFFPAAKRSIMSILECIFMQMSRSLVSMTQ